MNTLRNGQVWRQLNFPCFQVMILMLSHTDGQLMFAHAGTGQWNCPPLVMTDESGKWQYTEAEMLTVLRQCNFTHVGEARVTVCEGDEAGGSDDAS